MSLAHTAQRLTPKRESQESTALDNLILSDKEFLRLAAFVKEKTGITLSEVKRTMLQARLQKRLRALRMNSYAEYCTFLFSEEGVEHELGDFINVVTTNKTDFFREPHHFEYLIETAIPYLRKHGLIQHHQLSLWSAACSSGMEAYTMAMLLAEYAEQHHGFSWSILGTDISTKVLDKARQGVYKEEEMAPVPMALKKKYALRSADRTKQLVKIAPFLVPQVEFRPLNFMDAHYDLGVRFEIIFCRNAIIYFDRATQIEILKKLYSYLIPGGFLFLGHSESLNGFPLPFDVVGPTIYQKKLDA
jgi:chemotaxis protein methyltransferase CheR